MSDTIEALANAGLMPLGKKIATTENHTDSNKLYPTLNDIIEDEKRTDVKLTTYPTLVEMKSMIDDQDASVAPVIQPPSIEPLKAFLEKRAVTIEGLKQLRLRMAKHITHCKISNTVGNSASIIGGILCFVFPPVGVPVLLAGSATSLGTSITENVIEKRLRTEYTELLTEDSLAMKVCESNIKDITAWLVTDYSVGYSV